MRPEAFSGEAEAAVDLATTSIEKPVILPVPEAVHGRAPGGQARTSTRLARRSLARSIFYPGDAVIGGPNLLCGTFGGELPEQLAPVVDACTGLNVSAVRASRQHVPRSQHRRRHPAGRRSQQVSGNGATARGQASNDGVRTDAVVNDLEVAPFRGGFPANFIPIPGTERRRRHLPGRQRRRPHVAPLRGRRVRGRGRGAPRRRARRASGSSRSTPW